ncbi:MAG: hypothetical protein OIF51_07320, partial [Cellvibrionaceae bacterium]|nr:hypothetical protein [Cellvibrionaceae bacterium]
GDFENYDRDKAAHMDKLLAQHNKEVEWTDNLHRGFVKLSLDHKQAKAEFISVDNVLTEKYKVKRIKEAIIEKQNGQLKYRKAK